MNKSMLLRRVSFNVRLLIVGATAGAEDMTGHGDELKPATRALPDKALQPTMKTMDETGMPVKNDRQAGRDFAPGAID